MLLPYLHDHQLEQPSSGRNMHAHQDLQGDNECQQPLETAVDALLLSDQY